MALINFQSALYFCPKPSTSELLARLRAALLILSADLQINIRPMDELNAAIFEGDEARFEENGKQLFLLYDEAQRFYDTNEWSLQASVIDDYPNCTAVKFVPELTEAKRELTNFVWHRLLLITSGLVGHLKPAVAQINGVDDDAGGQVVSARTLHPESLPLFLTPYTYLGGSLGDSLASAVQAEGAFRVERLASGWEFQFVQDFYTQPSHQLENALRKAYRSRALPYKQTSVFDTN